MDFNNRNSGSVSSSTQGFNSNIINLQKGGRVNLTKDNPSLVRILVGLGWDTNKYSGPDFDLDASAFLVDVNQKSQPGDFIFYNNLEHSSRSVIHTGDNRTGDGDGDDEQIIIDFSKVPSHIQKIAIAVTIDKAIEKKQNFGQVENSYCRIVDNVTNQELIRYELDENFSIETAIVVGELYRDGSDWKFKAIGSGFSNGLSGLCSNYGLQTN